MALIRVLSPGLFTTVQDLGRPGHAALGISACGAADAVALRLGNRLLANPAAAPALEMTVLGATLQFASATWVALVGADCAASRGGTDPAGGAILPMWTAQPVGAGEILRCGAIRQGARTYLCIAGGLDVPRVLGSAATHVRSGLGGLQGRALRAGDELHLAASQTAPAPGQVAAAAIERLYPRVQPQVLRITDGPQRDRFPAATFETLLAAEYVVSACSDRMGVRLVGPPLRGFGAGSAAGAPAETDHGAPLAELLTEGVYLGAVQIPADGQPILLAVDHQTTGGYPKLASLIAADLGRLGQLRPADRVRFARVSLAEADALHREQELLLASPALVVA
jgi:antagonist of KipI